LDKKLAFLMALSITTLLWITFYAISEGKNNLEQIIVGRVIDGDTIEDSEGRTIRLLNINAPEKNLQESKEATEFLESFQGETLSLEALGLDKYQRTLGRIYFQNSYINLELVEKGFASKFLVEDDELRKFDKAEKKAVKEEKGIWKKSPISNCIKSEIKEKEEIVILTNSCPDLSFKGWKLKDESRKVYEFGNVKVNKIVIHSSSGNDNESDIYWNSKQNIWNNDRDTLYLFDNVGDLVNHHSYGY